MTGQPKDGQVHFGRCFEQRFVDTSALAADSVLLYVDSEISSLAGPVTGSFQSLRDCLPAALHGPLWL